VSEDSLKSTVKPSNRIIFTLEDTEPWESKPGRCSYPENIEQYPKGINGGSMMFFAQINLAEMTPLPEFEYLYLKTIIVFMITNLQLL